MLKKDIINADDDNDVFGKTLGWLGKSGNLNS